MNQSENGLQNSSGTSQLKDEQLKIFSELVKDYKELQHYIEGLEDKLSTAKSAFNQLRDHTIPDAMESLGFTDGTVLALDDGMTLKIKPITVASITADSRPSAHAWLVDNGYQDIIKRSFAISFGKDDTERSNKFQAELLSNQLLQDAKCTDKETVHYQTLCAMVREQIENGNDKFLDPEVMELLNIKVLKQAVIK